MLTIPNPTTSTPATDPRGQDIPADPAAATPTAPTAPAASEAHPAFNNTAAGAGDRLPPYPMDNAHPASPAHHSALADLFDPVTTARIRGLGVDLDGAACLEVGAGAGSIACWLAEQVGTHGLVTATDLNPDLMPHHPRLRPLRHDLTTGDPLPRGPFRLIHARLVLGHLPDRELILRELVDRLEPGGWLLVEDFAAIRHREDIVLCAPTPADAELYCRYQTAVGAVFDEHGTDARWARRMHRAFTTVGLADVHTTMHATDWAGGSPGAALTAATLTQLRPHLARHGLTGAELDDIAELLNDPTMTVHGHPLYSTAGARS